MSNPPKRLYIWCCECGYIEPGGTALIEFTEHDDKECPNIDQIDDLGKPAILPW